MRKADVRTRLKDSAVWRYGLSVVAIVVALVATYLLQPYVFRTPLFFLAIMVSTWAGGRGPGLLAVLLSTLSIGGFLSPQGFMETSFPHVPNVAAFLLTSVMVGAWSAARRRAEYALQQARDELEVKVRERTADLSSSNERLQKEVGERERAEEQLTRTNEELRALSARLHSVREEESARMAREIHDELGGALSSLRWGLEEIGEVVSETTGGRKIAGVWERVGEMITLTDNTVDAVRRIASELRPPVLEEFGLVEALRWQAGQFQERTGIAVHCDCPPGTAEPGPEHAMAVFRIVQEALTNVLRHAGATRVDIQMRYEGGHCLLTISDNGRGITEAEKTGPQSLGLLGMRERAHLLGGEVSVEGVEGRGTVVTLSVPAHG